MFCQIFPTCNQTSFQNSKENKMKHPDSPSDDLDLVKDLPLMIDDEKTETEVSGDEMKPTSSSKSEPKSEEKPKESTHSEISDITILVAIIIINTATTATLSILFTYG